MSVGRALSRKESSVVPQRRQSVVDPGMMDALEKAVHAELCMCRADPVGYANKVEDERACVRGNMLHRPGLPHPLQLQEGERPYREAIAALRATRPLPPLADTAAGMVRAARDHAQDLSRTGGTGHQGSDGSRAADRMSRHGRWSGAALENLHFGGGTAARIVVALLVDDGVPGRGHRKNILDERVNVAGVAMAPHPKYGSVCVQTFAAGYTDGRANDESPGRSDGRSADPSRKDGTAATLRTQTDSAPAKLALVDATRLSDESVLDLVSRFPGLREWLREGRRGNEGADAVKLAALQKARDVGALSEEQFQTAAARLLPMERTPEEREQHRLLDVAFLASALTEDEYRDAVARLHLRVDLQEGCECECRLSENSEWQRGVVTRITARSRSLRISAIAHGSSTEQVWAHVRRPEDRRTRAEILADQLAEEEAKRDAAQREVDTLLRGGCISGPPVLLAAPTPPPQGARYELFGFAFDVAAEKPVAVTAVTFMTRATQPARVRVYVAAGGMEAARRSATVWRPASPAVLLAGNESPNQQLRIDLHDDVRTGPGWPVALLIHSADDRRAVQYDRQQRCPVASDGVLSICGGDGAQQDRSVGSGAKLFAGFALVGSVEYREVNGAASAPPSSTPDAQPEEASSP